MSNIFLRLSVLFVLLGVSLGYWMGITHQFHMSPVHAHINLLGWVSMFLYGLFYRLFPTAAGGWMPKAHLFLATVGLAVMMVGLTIQLGFPTHMALVPPLMMVGPTFVVLGMAVFAVIVFRVTGGKAVAA